MLCVIAFSVFACYRYMWVSSRLPTAGARRVLIARGAIIYIEYEFKGTLIGFAESSALIGNKTHWWPKVVNRTTSKEDDFWIAIPIWMFVAPMLIGVALWRRRARLAFPMIMCRGC